MSKKQQPARYEIDESKGTEAEYVKIVNPIILGMQIAIGMFIVFPLFLIAIFFAIFLFGGIVGLLA